MNFLQMLKEDHESLRKLLKEHESFDENAVEKRRKTAAELFLELEIHTRLEEETLYPSVLGRTGEQGERLIRSALEEHRRMKKWMEELKKLLPTDSEYKAKFSLFRDTLERHLEEEEKELFPRAESPFRKKEEELDRLGEVAP